MLCTIQPSSHQKNGQAVYINLTKKEIVTLIDVIVNKKEGYGVIQTQSEDGKNLFILSLKD